MPPPPPPFNHIPWTSSRSRDVLLFGVAERPDFVALNSLGLNIPNRLIMECLASLTRLFQQLRHRVDGHVDHAADGPHGRTLAKHVEDFGLAIECYVLNDAAKTAVVSQRGMGEAIGFSRRGSRLAVFVNNKTMDDYIGRDLREKFEKPLIFQSHGAAAGSPVTERAHGYDVTILIDICNSILAARTDEKLSESCYEKMIQQARIIVSASAKNRHWSVS